MENGDNGAFLGASLTWYCPYRSSGSRVLAQIPVEIYEEVFAWLRPDVHPDMDLGSHRKFLTRLAAVCRYFASYATRELCGHLDFDGWHPWPSIPFEPSFTAVIKKLQLMATLPTEIKVCHVHDWFPPAWHLGLHDHDPEMIDMNMIFQERFPLLLSRLDNLATLTLSRTMISEFLLQTIGNLGGLQQLIISKCMADVKEDLRTRTTFGTHATPFPALRELAISDTNTDVLEDAFYALGGAPTIRILDITDSYLLGRLLPYISPQLVSLTGNICAIPVDNLLQFIKAHAALQDLTVYAMPYIAEIFEGAYSNLSISPDDVPNLRSFCGPFNLVSKFIHTRPSMRLALGLHLPLHEQTFPLPSSYGLTVFPSPQSGRPNWHYGHYVGWHSVINNLPDPDHAQVVWDSLETIGGGVVKLFMHMRTTEISATVLSSCFPNLVHLQIQLWAEVDDTPLYRLEAHGEYLAGLEEILEDLKYLNTFTLSATGNPDFLFWISPGDQHDLAHRLFQNSSTLTTVVLGPLMVWHSRNTKPRIGECSCELELLSPRAIREFLRRTATIRESGLERDRKGLPLVEDTRQVRDWNGMMAAVFGEQLGIEEDIQRILIP